MAEPELQPYLEAWQLSKPQLLTQTLTSRIYTVDANGETAILKLLAAAETEEQRGAVALRHFAGHGAVRLLRHSADAQLLEYAAGAELVTLVERGEDEPATRIIAQVLEQLHSVPQLPSPEGLVTLEHWFGALFDKAAADRRAGDASLYTRGAALAERLLAEPREVCVLHGDIHHRNIRQSARGWLSFDPKGLLGERTYDCANTLCNPVKPELVHNETRLLAQATILADALVLDLWRVLAFTCAYACLNASWWSRPAGSAATGAAYAAEIVQWHLKVAELAEHALGQV
ncbi:MAG: aminoglycoside phosphotransferase family protein [Anaerolineae bacterium]|nr:aminoglycoside phosphotransferase family protein [Anaerolineae bacterium]